LALAFVDRIALYRFRPSASQIQGRKTDTEFWHWAQAGSEPTVRPLSVAGAATTVGKLTRLDRYRTVIRGQLPRGPNGLARALLWTLQRVADYLGMA